MVPAAVADYRPDTSATQKIKKTRDNPNLTLQLIENPDIIATVANRTPKPFTVGFAAETQNVLDYANDKIIRKNLDMIVANDVSNKDIGFNSDLNAVTIIWSEGNKIVDIASKAIIANSIIQQISLQL